MKYKFMLKDQFNLFSRYCHDMTYEDYKKNMEPGPFETDPKNNYEIPICICCKQLLSKARYNCKFCNECYNFIRLLHNEILFYKTKIKTLNTKLYGINGVVSSPTDKKVIDKLKTEKGERRKI